MGFLFSTFSAVTELFVTAAVYTFLWQAWRHDRFRTPLLVFGLSYEILVNVAYMTFRLVSPAEGVEYSPAMSSFLAFHGILSLVMLLGLIGLSIAAIRANGRGENLLREHTGLTATFAGLWFVSIATGEVIYVVTYL